MENHICEMGKWQITSCQSSFSALTLRPQTRQGSMWDCGVWGTRLVGYAGSSYFLCGNFIVPADQFHSAMVDRRLSKKLCEIYSNADGLNCIGIYGLTWWALEPCRNTKQAFSSIADWVDSVWNKIISTWSKQRMVLQPQGQYSNKRAVRIKYGLAWWTTWQECSI